MNVRAPPDTLPPQAGAAAMFRSSSNSSEGKDCTSKDARGHSSTIAMAELHCSHVHLFRREPDEIRRRVDKWIALPKEFGCHPQ